MPRTIGRLQSSFLISLCIVILILLFACNVPSDKMIVSDFKEVFSKEAGNGLTPKITDLGPGEGDSDSVYEHIKFEVTVTKDVIPSTGWFSGQPLKKGQRLIYGEIVMFYQKDKSFRWKLVNYELKHLPINKKNR